MDMLCEATRGTESCLVAMDESRKRRDNGSNDGTASSSDPDADKPGD